MDQINELMARAAKQRSVGSTNMNAQSSRSHSVFALYLRGVNTKLNTELVEKPQGAALSLSIREDEAVHGCSGEGWVTPEDCALTGSSHPVHEGSLALRSGPIQEAPVSAVQENHAQSPLTVPWETLGLLIASGRLRCAGLNVYLNSLVQARPACSSSS